MFEVLQYYLENGLKVILHREGCTGIMCMGMVVHSGSMHENSSLNGISHYTEHMLLTQDNNPTLKNLFDKLHDYGATYSAKTDKSSTSFFINGLSSGKNVYIDLLEEIVFRNRCFLQETFSKERDVILREHSQFFSSFNQINDRTIQALYGSKGFGRITLGTVKNISSFTMKDIEERISKTYIPPNITLVVFGDFQYNEMQKMIQEKFSLYEGNVFYPEIEPCDAVPGFYCNSNYNGENAILCIGFRARAGYYRHIEDIVINLLLLAMCDPTLTRQYGYKLRVETGLAYNLGGFERLVDHNIAFGFSAIFNNDSADKVAKIMIDSLKNVKENGISEKEFAVVKRTLITNKLFDNSDKRKQVSQIIQMATTPFSYDPEEDIRRIESLSVELFNRYLKNLLDEKHCGIAYLGKGDIEKVISQF